MAQRQPSLFLSLSNEVEAVGGSGTANREPPMASQFAILGGSISGGPLTIRRGGLWRSVLAGCISGASVSLMDEIHGTPVSGREEPFACVLLGQRSRQGPFAFLRSSLHADCSSARADPGRLPNCDCCALHAARCKAADGRVAAASPTHQPGGAPEPCCVALPALSARPTLSAFERGKSLLKERGKEGTVSPKGKELGMQTERPDRVRKERPSKDQERAPFPDRAIPQTVPSVRMDGPGCRWW
jgi:hypothetical protein